MATKEEKAYLTAYKKAQLADSRFQAALQHQWGYSRAGTKRYVHTEDNAATDKARSAYYRAAEALKKALDRMRAKGGSIAANPGRKRNAGDYTVKKSGSNYVVLYRGMRTEGPPLATRATAEKYARLIEAERRPRPKRSNATGGPLDTHAARELELFTENDASLYRQQEQPIQKNLILKMAKGVYNHAGGVKLYGYLMESGAKKYAKEHSTSVSDWHHIFSPATRKAAAERFAHAFEAEAKLGNYDNLLPEKYKGWRIGKNPTKVRIKIGKRVVNGVARRKNGKVQVFVTPTVARKINPDSGVYAGYTISASRERLNSGGYTSGKYGQYFGVGAPLYSWTLEGPDTSGKQDEQGYIRADSRADLKERLLYKFPGAKFVR
jgi:hypothetical protein